MRKLVKKVNGRSTSSKSALITSDLHVGYARGLRTREAMNTAVGTTFPLNRYNKVALEHWEYCVDHLERPVPTIMHLNGEPFDGDNRKSLGAELWSPNMSDQMDDAVRLCSMFKFVDFTGCRGSGYHVRKDATDFEDLFYRRMNALAYSGLLFDEIKKNEGNYFHAQDPNYSGPVIDNYILFELNGVVFSCSHHVGTNRNFAYRTTSLGREMMALALEAGKHYAIENTPRIVVRSHTHYYVGIDYPHSWGCITPSWKFADTFAFRAGVGGSSATIGMLEFIIEPNGEFHINKLLLPESKYPVAPLLRL